MLMTLEEEMKLEIRRLEKEIDFLDQELEKLHKKILQVLMLKRKKEHDLRVLKGYDKNDINDREIQTTLAKILREQYKTV